MFKNKYILNYKNYKNYGNYANYACYGLLPAILVFKSHALLIASIIFLFILKLLVNKINFNKFYLKKFFSEEFPIFFLPWLFFIILLGIDVIWRGSSWRDFDIAHKIILAVGIYFLIPRLNLRDFCLHLALINIAFCLQAIYQVDYLNFDRAKGVLNNAILLGDFAILFSVILLPYTEFLFKKIYKLRNKKNINKKNIFILVILILGIFAGFLAMIYSQTRSAALFLLIYIVFKIFKLFKLSPSFFKKIIKNPLKIIRICLFILSAIFIVYIFHNIFQNIQNIFGDIFTNMFEIIERKSLETFNEIKLLNHQDYNTSFGLRLKLWALSWQYFTENPFFGIGFGQFYQDIYVHHRCLGDLPAMANLQELNHPHHELLWFLVNWGILGGLIYFSIFLTIFKFSNIHFNKNIYRQKTCIIYKNMVNYLTIGFMVFGLTQVMFAHQQALFAFLILLSLLIKQIK